MYCSRDNELVIQLQPLSIKLSTQVHMNSQREEKPEHGACPAVYARE